MDSKKLKKKFASLQIETNAEEFSISLKLFSGELNKQGMPDDLNASPISEQTMQFPIELLPLIIKALEDTNERYNSSALDGESK